MSPTCRTERKRGCGTAQRTGEGRRPRPRRIRGRGTISTGMTIRRSVSAPVSSGTNPATPPGTNNVSSPRLPRRFLYPPLLSLPLMGGKHDQALSDAPRGRPGSPAVARERRVDDLSYVHPPSHDVLSCTAGRLDCLSTPACAGQRGNRSTARLSTEGPRGEWSALPEPTGPI